MMLLDAAPNDFLSASPVEDAGQPDEAGTDLVGAWQIHSAFDRADDHVVIDCRPMCQLDEGTIAPESATDGISGLQGPLSNDARFSGGGDHITIWAGNDEVAARLQDRAQSYQLENGAHSARSDEKVQVALTFGSDGDKLYEDERVDRNNCTGGRGNEGPVVLGGSAIYVGDIQADKIVHFFHDAITHAVVYEHALSDVEIAFLVDEQCVKRDYKLIQTSNVVVF